MALDVQHVERGVTDLLQTLTMTKTRAGKACTHAAAAVAANCSRDINAEGDEIGAVGAQDAGVGLEVHDVHGVVAAENAASGSGEGRAARGRCAAVAVDASPNKGDPETDVGLGEHAACN